MSSMVSKANSGMVVAKCLETGKNVRIDRYMFETNQDKYVGATKGYPSYKKGVSTVLINENGVGKVILKEDFNPNEHVGFTKGKTMFRNKDGEVRQLSVDDPRVLSGEYFGVNKGNKFKNPKSKGQVIRIGIFNDKDELIYDCFSNFKKTCLENNLPMSLLTETRSKNSRIFFDLENMRKCDISRITNNGHIEYNGWYARRLDKDGNII